jgi:putative ABC transport system permease protein
VKFVRLVFKNLLRNKRRTTLTVASIALSLFLMTLLATILQALSSSTDTDTSHLRLITRHKVSLTNFLPESYWAKIRRVPGLVTACPTSWFGGVYIEERTFFAQFAVDPRTYLELVGGERDFKVDPDQARAWVNDRQGVMVNGELARKYGWKLGDVFTLKGTIYPFNAELKVDAICEFPDPAVYFHYDYLDEAIGRRGVVGTYWIKVDSPENLTPVAKKVDALFANSDAETLTETEKAFQAGFISMLGNVQGLVVNLSLVIAFTILMVAANTMSMTIRERTGEIAVLKALGFPPSIVLALLLSESTVIAAVGGFLGVFGFWGIAYGIFAVGQFRIPMVWFTLLPPMWLVVSMWVSSIGLGLASGLVPSLSAARRPIVEGLRQA